MYNTYLTEIDFNVGIYIRLSQEDKDKKYESDSESVINQRELLKNYSINNNFNLVEEYIDDGYSGTDFMERELDRNGRYNRIRIQNNQRFIVFVCDKDNMGKMKEFYQTCCSLLKEIN